MNEKFNLFKLNLTTSRIIFARAHHFFISLIKVCVLPMEDSDLVSGNGITSVSFSFFTTDQQKKLSVKQISRGVTFDRLGRAQRDGLYDPALGPLDPLERCETCSLSYEECPGHYGHIDLALPVFHPLLFNELYRLLRCCCFKCGIMRMDRDQKLWYARVLRLLMESRVGDAGNELSPDSATIDDTVRSPDPTNTPFSTSEPQNVLRHKFQYKTTHQQELWSKTISEIFASMPKRCSECDHPAQTLKKDGYLRLLQKPVSKRLRGKSTPGNSKPSDKGSGNKSRGKGKETRDNSAGQRIAPPTMLSSDEEESTEEDSDAPEGDNVDEEEEDGGGVIAGTVPEKQNAGGHTLSELPVNISPQKALHLLKLVFENDKELVEAMYGVRVSSNLLADPGIFFLRSLLVPPNRFRPPVTLGENAFEHPMNANLKSIMQENQLILNLMASPAQNAEEREQLLDSDALMRHWKSMQNHVNTMIDSAKAEKKVDDSVKGVRQELERKEGLMRMHMMGKRVNFACRSVISPDPFMDTDQVPHSPARAPFCSQ